MRLAATQGRCPNKSADKSGAVVKAQLIIIRRRIIAITITITGNARRAHGNTCG